MSDAKTAATDATEVNYDDILVQYLVVRKDLLKKPFNWNHGSLMGNACHASVAAITQDFQDEDVQQYLGLRDDTSHQMHKVVLQAKSEEELMSTAEILKKGNVRHKLWIEEPEKIATCLATRPYKRKILKPLLKALKLFR